MISEKNPRGAGRKRIYKENMKVYNLKAPPTLIQAVADSAKKQGKTKDAYIRELLIKGLGINEDDLLNKGAE